MTIRKVPYKKASLMAFNIAAIEIECDRIRTIIRDMKSAGGIAGA
jgi:hypothetical protein